MDPSYLISASILSADFSRLGEEIHEAEAAGTDWIHVDVMDGHFVPNLTLGPVIVEACRRVTQLPLDVHLMVDNPEDFLNPFARAGASIISIHVEIASNLDQVVRTIHELGCKSGIVLRPATPVDAVLPLLPIIDLVLVLSVNPGYSGQSFMPEVLPKITALRHEIEKIARPIMLEVDGGITIDTLPQVRDAGANVFVAATAIFKNPAGITPGIRQLRSLLIS